MWGCNVVHVLPCSEGGGKEAARFPDLAVHPALWWLGRALSSCGFSVLHLLSVFLQEKLKYFPVCVSTKIHQEDDAEEGLGSLPRNISSLSSLLLFNTTENL